MARPRSAEASIMGRSAHERHGIAAEPLWPFLFGEAASIGVQIAELPTRSTGYRRCLRYCAIRDAIVRLALGLPYHQPS
jgi:hypothetical protein